MAIFVNLKQYARFLGYLQFDKPYAKAISIVLSIFVTIGCIGICCTTLTYLLMEENDLHDQIQCVSSMFAVSLVIWIAGYFSYYKQHFLDEIDNMEMQIIAAERKHNTTCYQQTMAEFEDFTFKIILFVNMGLVIGAATIPPILTSYYNYYVKDMGAASFTGEPSK